MLRNVAAIRCMPDGCFNRLGIQAAIEALRRCIGRQDPEVHTRTRVVLLGPTAHVLDQRPPDAFSFVRRGDVQVLEQGAPDGVMATKGASQADDLAAIIQNRHMLIGCC